MRYLVLLFLVTNMFASNPQCVFFGDSAQEIGAIDSVSQLVDQINIIKENHDFDHIFFANGGEDVAHLVLAKKSDKDFILTGKSFEFYSGDLYISSSKVLKQVLENVDQIKPYPKTNCGGYKNLVQEKGLDRIIEVDFNCKRIKVTRRTIHLGKPVGFSYAYIEESVLVDDAMKIIDLFVEQGKIDADIIRSCDE